MLHLQPRPKGDGFPQKLPGPPWQAQHQVQGDVPKPAGPGVFHSPDHILGRMGPAQKAQLFLVGGLEPHGQPVEPGGPHLFKKLPVYMGGVCLQGDFRCGGKGKLLFHPLKDGAQPVSPQKIGGAAAKVDRGKLPALELSHPGGEGGKQGMDVGVHHLRGGGTGVEIAVGAFGLAEGHVEVEAEHGITTNEKV